MSLVSTIITTHNRGSLLKRAIESVLNQTYKDIECIVVDDASIDSTKEICSNYDINYIYIEPKDSKGGNHARNLGIKASKGEYIAFLDDDDYWLPTKIEKQLRLISEKNCEMVHCKRYVEKVNKDGSVICKEDAFFPPMFEGDYHEKVLFQIPSTTSCILISRNLLYDIGFFDESLKYWQDYDLLIRIAQKSPIYFVKEPLIVYRIDYWEKNRLSNKYYQWLPTIDYFSVKYKSLYSNLDLYNKLRVKMFFNHDAKNRARECGLRWHHFLHAIKYNLLYLFFRFIKK